MINFLPTLRAGNHCSQSFAPKMNRAKKLSALLKVVKPLN
jgi:hypothetical protein